MTTTRQAGEAGRAVLGEGDLFEIADILRTARGVKHVRSRDYALAEEIVCYANRSLRDRASDLEQVIQERDEAVRLLREAPVVLLDRAVIELRDEPALRSYAKQLAGWAPRAKAFLSTMEANTEEVGGV